jgi:hypothetical protein
MRKATQHVVSRRKFFGIGAAATGAALTGAPSLAAAGTSQSIGGDAGIGPAGGFANFFPVVRVSGATLVAFGLYDFIPLGGELRYNAPCVYSSIVPGIMGKTFSLPSGSRIVRINTLGVRDTSGRQFWFLGRTNLLTSTLSQSLANITTPVSDGEVQASWEGDITVNAGDIFNIDIGDTSFQNRVSGVTIQYIAPTADYFPISPTRVYDSRSAAPAPGALTPNQSRVVSVKDGRDGNGGVNAPDVVPAGARAVTFNITATGTNGPNFLGVTPGDAGGLSTSSLNWGGGSDIANSGTVKLDGSRQVKVFMGDQSGSSQFIIDITGYYL